MDTSEKYIKMCREAKEIQEIFHESMSFQGSWVNNPQKGTRILYWSRYHGNPPAHYFSKESIWLPRQDQLQEMAFVQELWHNGFVDFQYWYTDIDIENFASFEQLWLGFIMGAKYNKVWENGSWTQRR